MNKLRICILTVLSIITLSINAQTTIVTGLLKDSTLNEPEAYATVRVYDKGDASSAIAMFLTKDDGSFCHQIKGKGIYKFVFSSVGKEDLQINVELGNHTTTNLGTLYIKESTHALQGIEIVAQKPLVKMEVDRMIYNVAEDADSKTATVLDMLRKVPMVNVDGQDNITVNGSSSFKVLVDGKPNVMFSSNPSMVFKSMPAVAVKNIEVITNPGAKYDAEGVGGVLNIVTNKIGSQAAQSMDGIMGTVSAGVGIKNAMAAAFLSGQTGKFSFNTNVFYSQSFPMETEVMTEQKSNAGIISSISNSKTRVPFTMANVSMGYEINPMSSLSATFGMTDYTMKNHGQPSTIMSGAKYGNKFAYSYDMEMVNRYTSLTGSIDYRHFFNTEKTRSITLTYQITNSPIKNKLYNDFHEASTTFIDLTDRYSDGRNKTMEHIFQADYSMPLASGHNLDLGAKIQLHNATSDSKYYLNNIYNKDLSMEYSYNNRVLAGYTEYNGKWKKIGTKAGLRYEKTWQDVEFKLGNGKNFSINYGSIVPTASLSYSPTPTSNVGLTYSMRISRPGITYLNPYVNHPDPYSVTYGNSELDIEKSHNISLVLNTFSSRFMMNATLHYNYTGNGIGEYRFYRDNILHTTYGNIMQRKQGGLNIYANWLMAKNTRLFFNGGINYTDMQSNEMAMSNSGWHFNGMTGIQQTLPWNVQLGVYLINSSKTHTIQGWTTGYNIVSANISKAFLKDKLNIGIQAATGLAKGGIIKMDTYSKGHDFERTQNIHIPIRNISLNVSYTFGKNNGQQMNQRQSKIQNDYIQQKSQSETINNIGGMNK